MAEMKSKTSAKAGKCKLGPGVHGDIKKPRLGSRDQVKVITPVWEQEVWS